MFLEFFDWFCKTLSTVYKTMDKFTLFNNFSYFDFCIALLSISIIIKLLNFITFNGNEKSSNDQITHTENYIYQYDSYNSNYTRKKRS